LGHQRGCVNVIGATDKTIHPRLTHTGIEEDEALHDTGGQAATITWTKAKRLMRTDARAGTPWKGGIREEKMRMSHLAGRHGTSAHRTIDQTLRAIPARLVRKTDFVTVLGERCYFQPEWREIGGIQVGGKALKTVRRI